VKFFASGRQAHAGPLITKIIEAPAWIDAQKFAARVCGAIDLIVHQTGNDGPPADIALQYVGTDAGDRGASLNGRRLQVKTDGGEWKDDAP
jgi:hypothetical protein